MKGKVLAIITALLFGASMLASPVVNAATDTKSTAGMEQAKPDKKKSTKKKKATKKKQAKAKKKAPKTKKTEKTEKAA